MIYTVCDIFRLQMSMSVNAKPGKQYGLIIPKKPGSNQLAGMHIVLLFNF